VRPGSDVIGLVKLFSCEMAMQLTTDAVQS
jgi:hypothetical protein